MRRSLLPGTLLLLLTASAACAGGLNLAWNDCYGDGFWATNKAFACSSNSGSFVAYGTYIPSASHDALNGNEIVLDLQAATDNFPDWWAFKNSGTCPTNAVSVQAPSPTGSAVLSQDQLL